MANEYGRWFVRNDPQKWRQKLGAYNRPFSERYQRPAEYTPSVKEYSHYPAMKNIVAEQEEKNKELQNDDAFNKSDKIKTQSKVADKIGQNVGNIVKNVVGRAVAVVGGSAVVVSGYQAIVAEKAAGVEVVPVAEVVADWDGWDASDLNITLTLKDAEGNVIKEIPAGVSVKEKIAPTCTEAGSITYIASAEDDGEYYSDENTVALSAIGHKLKLVKTTVDGDTTIYEYECEHCDEKITKEDTATEID